MKWLHTILTLLTLAGHAHAEQRLELQAPR